MIGQKFGLVGLIKFNLTKRSWQGVELVRRVSLDENGHAPAVNVYPLFFPGRAAGLLAARTSGAHVPGLPEGAVYRAHSR